ncbi:MAG: ATP-binding protein [Clostridia bacterium]|nr:ATP-binding protein [Clostridia bacterium]
MFFQINDYASLREAIEDVSRFLNEKDVPSERVFDARLVVNELIGNVFRHAKSTARLGVELNGGFLELHVLSEIPFIPPTISKRAEVFAENGRGLFLVDSVSEERSLTEEGGILVRIKIK